MRRRYFAVLGSRLAPADVLEKVRTSATKFADRGFLLRAGPLLSGPDRAAMEGAAASSLPSGHFAYGPDDRFVEYTQADGLNRFALRSPYTAPVFALCRAHIENFGTLNDLAKSWWCATAAQLMGLNVDAPSEVLLVWTPDGATGLSSRTSATGHTARGIALAEALGIRVMNLRGATSATG